MYRPCLCMKFMPFTLGSAWQTRNNCLTTHFCPFLSFPFPSLPIPLTIDYWPMQTARVIDYQRARRGKLKLIAHCMKWEARWRWCEIKRVCRNQISSTSLQILRFSKAKICFSIDFAKRTFSNFAISNNDRTPAVADYLVMREQKRFDHWLNGVQFP